jgi:uncharacterized protein DUF1559
LADVLFNIACTTCEARLNVRDKSAIGQIVNCPKCGGMVQIEPPPGWQEPVAEPTQQEEPATPKRAPSVEQPVRPQAKKPAKKTPTRVPTESAEARPAKPAANPTSATVSPKEAKPARSKPASPEEPASQPRPEKPKKSLERKAAGAAAAGVAAASVAPASEPAPPTPSPAEAVPAVEPMGADAPPLQTPTEMAPPDTMSTASMTQWANPAEAVMRRWLVWGAVPVASVVILIGAWSLFSGDSKPEPNSNPQAPVVTVPDDGQPQVPLAPIHEFDDRWIPDSPQLVLSLDVAGSQAAGQLAPLLKSVPPLSQAILGELFQGFGLKPEAVERLCWSSADLVDWSGTGVVVVELAEGQSTASLRSAGTATETKVDGIEVRQLTRPTWTRAFAVLDERTIVTGEEGILRQLVERGERPAKLGQLQPLLDVAPADVDIYFALDLQAAAKARWPLPTEWLDVWPQGRDAWHLIWRLPSALSFSFDRDDLALAELGLLCDGETVADKVRVALEQWIPQAKSVLAARIEGLPASAQAGEITAGAVAPYQLAMSGASAALASSHLEVEDRCVWLRADCGNNSSAWTAAAANSRAAMQGDWYRAAGNLDTALQTRLHGAMTGYTQAEQKAPPGAINSGPLPPESVLSWITAMLPYLGHESWAEDIQPRYSWDDRKNRPVTMRALDAVQNPAVSTRETASGYPVTHYVGMAGIGPEAADLPRDDPRAGIFGYRESRPLTDVPDGASNTIATVGVSGKLGSWAAGGAATVRGFTEKPYINGPDGFGSGQPGGMFVGMADGSSRFLSADIDPTVLEQLATAAGGESIPPLEPPTDQVVRVEPQETPPSEMVPPTQEMPARQPPEEAPVEQPVESAIPVAQRLQTPLPGISMTNTPLHLAIRAIENYGSLLVTYDLDTMSAMNVALDQPVSEQELDVTVGKALDVVLTSCGLKAVAKDNQLWVTGAAQASETPRTVRYTVADLTSPRGGTPAAELAAWIPRLIAPETWQANGGPGTIQVNNGALEITQTGAVQLQVLVFCERLRVARGLSPRSGRPARQFPLAARRARAASLLQQPVTINFFRPTALRRVLQELDARCDALVAANWLALAKEGKSPAQPTSLSVAQAPLARVLDQMLQPLGLDYRAVDERTIAVTTRAAADAHFEREFCPILGLLKGGETVPALIDRVRGQVDAGTWQSNGGKGSVQFDEPSGCLIVLQTQRGHVAIEQYLAGLHATQKSAVEANTD